jgi:hypothetical protein
MESRIIRLFKRLERREIELEVEEELRFHMELLRLKHIQQGMSQEEAKAATRKRFGDIERVKNQCVEISRRSHPLLRVLKSFITLVFLAGILVCAVSTDFSIRHVGEMLIAVAILSRTLLYAHGLSPTSVLTKKRNTFATDVN